MPDGAGTHIQSKLEQDHKNDECAGEFCRDEFSTEASDQSSSTKSIMDPFTLSTGGVALANTFVSGAMAVKAFHSDYKGAEEDSYHVHRQREHLQINRQILETLALDVSSQLTHAQSSLKDLEAALPSEPCSGKKKDKFRWAQGRKRKAQGLLDQLKEAETSTILTLQMSSNKAIEDLAKKLDQASSHQEAMMKEIRRMSARQETLSHRQQYARLLYCQWIVSLTMFIRLVMFDCDDHTVYNLHLQWRIFCSIILIFRIRIIQGFPRALHFSLRQMVELQPDKAESIANACQFNDLRHVQQLLSHAPSLVNAILPNNLSPLRFAIRGGHIEMVKLLLEQGADPNRTFGKWDTSPLNNAFLTRRVDIVRILLSWKADLDYVNSRTWTNVYYLWGPENSNYLSIREILDICFDRKFEGWNFQDFAGWAPIHRASAYGEAEHIERLFDMLVVDQNKTPLTLAHWSPLQCAIRFGNSDTFQYLLKVLELSPYRLLRMRDRNGWTLLHLAAAGGSEEIITCLLSLGLQPNAQTAPASFLIPEKLDNKALTPRMIAEYYGNLQAYDNALRAAGQEVTAELSLHNILSGTL